MLANDNFGRQSSFHDEDIHIQVLGAPETGKSTLISWLVTHSPRLSHLPFMQPARNGPRYICTLHSSFNATSTVAEIVDTSTSYALTNPASSPDSKSHDGSSTLKHQSVSFLNSNPIVSWAYVIVFDLTRHETFQYARWLLSKIRAADSAKSMTSGLGGRHEKSTVIIIGNKRDKCQSLHFLHWLKESFGRLEDEERSVFLFTGSVLDNKFSFASKQDSEVAMLLKKVYKMDSDSSLRQHRFNIEQIFYLVKAIDDYYFNSSLIPQGGEYEDKKWNDDIYSALEDESMDSDEEAECMRQCRTWCGCVDRRKRERSKGS